MKEPREERRPPITPQLAVRVAVLGGIAFVLFGIVFFRLWFLQVLSGEDYVSQARENRVRKVRIDAPRGDIVDRNNKRLVQTRVAPVVQIAPESLPKAVRDQADQYRRALAAAEGVRQAAADQLRSVEREIRERHDGGRKATRAQKKERRRLKPGAETAPAVAVPTLPASETALADLYRRLGRAIGMRPRQIHERVIREIADTPYSNATIKTAIRRQAFNYLRERQDEFPGVEVEKQYLRDYPHNELAAQLFGTLREISPDELTSKDYRGVAPGTRIGVSGLEKSYDRYLRGKDGFTRLVVNALGSRDSQAQSKPVAPTQGQRVKLSLDLALQEAANNAMQRAIVAAAKNGAKAGAYVAMDPRNGEILALGSYPSFNANVFAKPISQRVYDTLNSQAQGAPLYNRAIAAAYPTGSIFKPITAMAALTGGLITPSTAINDSGSYDYGGRKWINARNASFGTLTLSRALEVSSDIFFYKLGAAANDKGPIIQAWAKRLGLGRPTGIDVPGESSGLIPDRKWRDAGYAAYLKCAKKANVTAGTTSALLACGGIERGWSGGDNVNLAVGQGDLQATPLQMAVAYSTIVNGGKVVTPHLGMAIQDGQGRLVEELHTPISRRVKMDPGYRSAIMAGLRGAASAPDGTSSDVFKGFPKPIYGKTGTAERQPNPDQSWYACYVEDPERPIVVITTVERGGFGAETAAPAARLILNQWFHLRDKQFHAGTNVSR